MLLHRQLNVVFWLFAAVPGGVGYSLPFPEVSEHVCFSSGSRHLNQDVGFPGLKVRSTPKFRRFDEGYG
jgi:hypothetical protein